MDLTSVLGRVRLTALLARIPSSWSAPVPPPVDLGGDPGGDLRADPATAARDRAREAGHSRAVVDALGQALATLDDRTRAQVVDPLGRWPDGGASHPRVRSLRLGGAVARQTDGTTCGSAVLGLLAAAGDPVLALWLVTGEALGARGTSGVEPAVPALPPGTDAAARFRRLQQVVKNRTNRKGLGPFEWPAAFGTPPWGAAREARYAGVRYTHRVVDGPHRDGARGGGLGPVLDAALAAAARGAPVPLFTGGDVAAGPATAVPRHVVLLATADRDSRCELYEPSSGTVHRLAAADLAAGPRDPAVRRALGGWPHVVWALLPAGRAGDRTPTA
ncbi:hypothetical protein IF650_12790 [Cellulosimicrobium terreum]|nr:hypothetical protein [Cellulosimicrobium terreum]